MNGPTPPAASPTTIVPPSAAAANEGKARVRRQWSAEDKAVHLALFAECGLSQAKYCAQMGISPATLSLWCRQSREADGAPAAAAREPTFAEVFVTEPAAGASTPRPAPLLVIHLGGGTRVEVAEGTDPLWLARLLQPLRGA